MVELAVPGAPVLETGVLEAASVEVTMVMGGVDEAAVSAVVVAAASVVVAGDAVTGRG
jgi:hypothetical protein